MSFSHDYDFIYGIAGLALAYAAVGAGGPLLVDIRTRLHETAASLSLNMADDSYAHGLAGVLHALSLPSMRTRKTRSVAKKIIASIRERESTRRLEASEDARWCDGAVSISCALEIAATNGLPIPLELQAQYRARVAKVAKSPGIVDPSLCHGELGRRLMLDSLAQKIEHRRAVRMLPAWDTDPGLFNGASGYVYAAARRRAPSRVPNVLFFEPF
jgi:lantibiotic modifying enzyme